MLVQCEVRKPFVYTTDGIRSKPAHTGDVVGIPAELVEGLASEGYVRPVQDAKSSGPAPENKAIMAAPENKDPLDHDGDGTKGGSVAAPASDDLPALRSEYQDKMGKRPFPGWDAAEIRRRMGA